jgi:hypothetical protein
MENEKKEDTQNTSEAPTPDPMEAVNAMNVASERMERANKKREELFAKQEAKRISDTIGGTAEAGKTRTEMSPKDYAQKVLRGEIE